MKSYSPADRPDYGLAPAPLASQSTENRGQPDDKYSRNASTVLTVAPPIPRRKRQSCSSRLRQRSRIAHQPQPSPPRLSHTDHAQRSAFSVGQRRSFTEIKGVRPHHHRATAGGGFDQVFSAQRRARRRRSSPRCWRRGCRSTASGATRAGRAVRSVPMCWSARWRRPCAIAAWSRLTTRFWDRRGRVCAVVSRF